MSKHLDFILGPPEPPPDRRLSFKFSRAKLPAPLPSSVFHYTSHPRATTKAPPLSEDGLFVSPGPLTTEIVKPYQLDTHRRIITSNSSESHPRVLELTVHEIKMADPRLITSLSLLYHEQTICKLSPPFCHKLCKLLLNRDLNLSIKLTSTSSSVVLPLPLPNRTLKNHPITIDFSLPTPLVSGQCVALVTLESRNRQTKNLITFPHNDPNFPQNYVTRPHTVPTKSPFFSLVDSGLAIEAPPVEVPVKPPVEPTTSVINEPATFSLRDITFNGWFEAARPLRPLKMAASNTETQIMVEKNEVVALTVLRAVQVPVREENGINPVLVVQWGEIVEVTKMGDNPNPIWQQTFNFTLPKSFQEEMGIRMTLYDQHPGFGRQWLGEFVIPTDGNENYYEIERWINLSRLKRPVERFGYKETGDTRIYVCLKVKKNFGKEEKVRTDLRAKTLQRCVVPYKVEGVVEEEVGRVVMMLRSLPVRVGPVMPRQALKIGKVDYFGRAGLLASLLAAVDKEVFVAIGTSQVRQVAAYVVTLGKEVEVWDPENGERWNVSDTKCSLVRVARMVNHCGIWKNLQSTILSNLRFNLKNSKDWQLITSTTSATPREPQILTLDSEGAPSGSDSIEDYLKDQLSQFRSRLGFITIFNRHAASTLRPYLEALSLHENKDRHLEQLKRVYYTSGYVVNLRYDGKEELLEFLLSTKIQEVTGPVEFSICCHLERHIGRIYSLWLAVAILRTKE